MEHVDYKTIFDTLKEIGFKPMRAMGRLRHFRGDEYADILILHPANSDTPEVRFWTTAGDDFHAHPTTGPEMQNALSKIAREALQWVQGDRMKTASQSRPALIRLASSLPTGDPNRGILLEMLRKKASSWRKETIEIQTVGQPVTVEAHVKGNWAVHKPIRGSGGAITLISEGRLVAKGKSIKDAKSKVDVLLDKHPRLINATESDIRRMAQEVIGILEGRVLVESILRECGLTRLGEMSRKIGPVYGIEGKSMRIRVGARDVVLMSWSGRFHYGKIEGSWGAEEMVTKSKVTESKLRSWCDQIKRSPTTVELRAEIRGDR